MALQISKLPEVENITALSRSSIYRLVAADEFPKPIKLSSRSSGWIKSEIEEWLEERIKASRKEA